MTRKNVFNIAFTAYDASGTQGHWSLPWPATRSTRSCTMPVTRFHSSRRCRFPLGKPEMVDPESELSGTLRKRRRARRCAITSTRSSSSIDRTSTGPCPQDRCGSPEPVQAGGVARSGASAIRQSPAELRPADRDDGLGAIRDLQGFQDRRDVLLHRGLGETELRRQSSCWASLVRSGQARPSGPRSARGLLQQRSTRPCGARLSPGHRGSAAGCRCRPRRRRTRSA